MDTAGQERFRSINKSYYRKADCCLLVYDITDKKSFDDCKDYYNKNIKEMCKKNIKVILLGNKSDLANERKVSLEEATNFALKNEYMFMETSCLKNANVADAFETLIEITNIESKNNIISEKKEDENIKVIKINHKESGNKKLRFC